MLNETKSKFPVRNTHVNFMGGPSYDLSPFARLYVMASSSLYGEKGYYSSTRRTKKDDEMMKYLEARFGSYGSGMSHLFSDRTRSEAMQAAIEESLAYDAELTLKFLGWLRNKALIRATPAAGLAVAAHSGVVRGSGMLRYTAGNILSRMDDVANCLAYYLDKYGKPIPNALKKVLASRISTASEYELAKYAGKNKKVTLLDAVRLTHAHSEAVDKFCSGELSLANEGLETWEAIISGEGSSKESWTKAVGVMGHMALLRNLRNLEKYDVEESLYLNKLTEGAKTGKQLPFRYYSAWLNVRKDSVRKALEKCLDISVGNLPKLGGRSLVLVDNSGSAVGAKVSAFSNVSVSVCGNLMGVLTGLVSDSGKIGVFGDRIKYVPIAHDGRGTVLETLDMVNDIGGHVGYSTENGIWLALDDAIRSGEKFDRIFIYSDMQAGHGGLYGLDGEKYPVFAQGRPDWYRYIDVPKLVSEYRQKVNPACKLYSIQIGGYSDNIFPEFYPDTCIMGGWSSEVFRFVGMFEKDPVSVEELFRKTLGVPKRDNRKAG